MAIETIGVPASVAAVTVPQAEPKAGVALTWKFVGGADYTLLVEHTAYVETDAGWEVTTRDGRTVSVYRPHVLVFETRNVTIQPRKVANHGE